MSVHSPTQHLDNDLNFEKRTFLILAAEGDGAGVAVDDIQEEVSRVVVGLARVP